MPALTIIADFVMATYRGLSDVFKAPQGSKLLINLATVLGDRKQKGPVAVSHNSSLSK